jgi:hypothetical protein
MAFLSAITWIAFGSGAIGLVVYFTYARHHSLLNRSKPVWPGTACCTALLPIPKTAWRVFISGPGHRTYFCVLRRIGSMCNFCVPDICALCRHEKPVVRA